MGRKKLGRTERLTDSALKSARRATQPYVIRDAEVKGFTARIEPSGIITFYAEWGRAKRRALRDANGQVMHFPVTTVSAARAAALAVLADAAKNGTPEIARRKVKAMTLDTFLDDHYEPWALANLKSGAATVANIRAQFRKDLGSKPLADITKWHIDKFKQQRLKADIKPVTVNRDIDRIMAAMNKAVEWKEKTGLAANPIAGVKDVRDDGEKRVRFLDPEEEKRLREALQKRETERREARASANRWRRERGYDELPEFPEDGFTDHLTPVVLLALNTGLRRGELLKLDWSRVRLDARRVEVPAATRKVAKVLHIPLNAEAHDVLTRLRKHSSGKGLVFGDGVTPLKQVKTSWKGLMEAAKIENFRFHDQRHHFASWLVMSDVNLLTVRDLLGHSSVSMTERYSHLSEAHKADAVEKLVARK
jgi:integrase